MGVSFTRPMAVVVKRDQLLVLDSDGARVQVLDRSGKWLRSFETGVIGREMALAADSEGNIYLSNVRPGRVRVFSASGQRKGEFGRYGSERGEMRSTSGLRIDAQDRIYLADKDNRRVSVFQIQATAKTTKSR